MQLSINAIITLVIALALLGLGLGVVNGVLSFGGDTLAQTIDGYQLDIPATFDDPLVVSDPLALKRDDSTIVLTSVYNKATPSCNVDNEFSGVWMYLDCPDVALEGIQTQPLDVPVGTSKTVAMSIELGSNVAIGTYPCILRVYCENINDRGKNDGIVSGDPSMGTIISETLFVKVS